jgi:hypothetical protein
MVFPLWIITRANHLEQYTKLLLASLAMAGLRWGCLTQLLCLLASGLYLRQLAQQMPMLYLENHSLFLVSLGTVMYFSGTILLYVFTGHFIGASYSMVEPAVLPLIFVANSVQLGLFMLAFHRTSPPLLLPSARSHE